MTSLTIEELKKALNKSGVALPSGRAKKEEYVKLYEDSIALNASIADTYSSDEENSQSCKKVTSTNSLNDSQNIPEAVENLSDSQLYEKLKDFGYDAGPVVPNTRRVYIKKLIQLLQGDANVSYTNGVNNAVHVDSLEISDHEVEIPELPIKRSVRESSLRGSPRPGSSKQEPSPLVPEERPVTSRVSYIERVPRQRVVDRSEKPNVSLISGAGGNLDYIGRWSPRVFIRRLPTAAPAKIEEKSPSRKNAFYYICILIVIAAIVAAGYYQFTVNDPYQQLQEDAENEVKKLAARKTEI